MLHYTSKVVTFGVDYTFCVSWHNIYHTSLLKCSKRKTKINVFLYLEKWPFTGGGWEIRLWLLKLA